jgi:hypothetical protein
MGPEWLNAITNLMQTPYFKNLAHAGLPGSYTSPADYARLEHQGGGNFSDILSWAQEQMSGGTGGGGVGNWGPFVGLGGNGGFNWGFPGWSGVGGFLTDTGGYGWNGGGGNGVKPPGAEVTNGGGAGRGYLPYY